jgi:hypothetical protein
MHVLIIEQVYLLTAATGISPTIQGSDDNYITVLYVNKPV